MGTSFGAGLKPFFGAIADEAGKDTYSALKRLIARLWHTEQTKLYASRVGVNLIAECGANYVALPIGLPGTFMDSATLRELERALEKDTVLGDWRRVRWDEVKNALENRDGYSDDGPWIHVLSHDGERWMIDSYRSWQFFTHLKFDRWSLISRSASANEPLIKALQPTSRARKKGKSKKRSRASRG